MHSRIEPLVSAAGKAANTWTDVYLALENGGLPSGIPHQRLAGCTLQEFDKRIRATLDLVPALAKLDESSQVMFLPRVDAAAGHLKSINRHLGQILTELAPQPSSTFKDPTGNLEQIQRVDSGSVTATVNSGPAFDQINGALVSLFDVVAGGVRFERGQSFSLYLSHGEQLRALLAEAQPILVELKQLRERAVQAHAESTQCEEELARIAESLTESLDAAKKDRSKVAEAHDEAQAKVAVIRETSQAAATLQTQVSNYSAEFEGLQKSLTMLLDQHSSFTKEMDESRERNQSRESEIDRLLQKAESMIQGATTAGLGDSLEATRKLYEKRMGGARTGFLLSVAVLIVSAVPLLAQLFPGLFVPWLPAVAASTSPATGIDAFLSLVGKLALLFPATWLTSFFSKTYAECFHLEREYAHKAALARSVEGFKKQAPKYQEEITTAVFFEVQANPSKQSAPDAAEHPIMGPLMKKFIDALPMGKPGP